MIATVKVSELVQEIRTGVIVQKLALYEQLPFETASSQEGRRNGRCLRKNEGYSQCGAV